MVLCGSWRNNSTDYNMAITRAPNPITHRRALPINPMSIVTEFLELMFTVITPLIIVSKEKSKKATDIRQSVQ